jgi:hypothetical protein
LTSTADNIIRRLIRALHHRWPHLQLIDVVLSESSTDGHFGELIDMLFLHTADVRSVKYKHRVVVQNRSQQSSPNKRRSTLQEQSATSLGTTRRSRNFCSCRNFGALQSILPVRGCRSSSPHSWSTHFGLTQLPCQSRSFDYCRSEETVHPLLLLSLLEWIA